MDETFGFVEETVAFWDISIVLQNFCLIVNDLINAHL